MSENKNKYWAIILLRISFGCMILAGVALVGPLSLEVIPELPGIFSRHPWLVVSVVLIVFSGICVSLANSLNPQSGSFTRVDVDVSGVPTSQETVIEWKREETSSDPHPPLAFSTYFKSAIDALISKANVADRKASLLLEQGMLLARLGLGFYLVAIVVWQVLMFTVGYRDEYLIGLVSCSFLFIFIEFLSAWFLRQYRHFVDTSTYLLKVKTILDRYFLAWLAIEESGERTKHTDTICSMLSDQIAWPPEIDPRKSDHNFAREVIDSATQMLKAVRREQAKEKAESPNI